MEGKREKKWEKAKERTKEKCFLKYKFGGKSVIFICFSLSEK